MHVGPYGKMNQLTFFSETTVPLKQKLGWNINLEWACRKFCADWKFIQDGPHAVNKHYGFFLC